MTQRRSLPAVRAFIGLAAATTLAVVLLLGATSARAARSAAWWLVDSHTVPTNLAPGGEGEVRVTVTNPGVAPTKGVTKIVDTLPPGLQATGVVGLKRPDASGPVVPLPCAPTSGFPPEGGTITCTFPGPETLSE